MVLNYFHNKNHSFLRLGLLFLIKSEFYKGSRGYNKEKGIV